MSTVTQSSSGHRDEGLVLSLRHTLIFRLACAAALIVGLLGRLVGWDRPFWLDETFTGAIALQPKLSVLFDDCLNELGGPIYYAFSWVWAKVFGVSNLSLRLPSFIFSITAPVLIFWRGDRDWLIRWVWLCMLAVMYMVVFYSLEARAYSLLMLLGTIQVMLFRSLIVKPTRNAAYGWAAVSAIFIMTHLFTLPLTGLQGLILVAVRGRAMMRYSPALVLFLLPFGWLTLQLPIFQQYINIGAWQKLVNLRSIVDLQRALVGSKNPFSWAIIILIVAMLLTFVWDGVHSIFKRRPFPYAVQDMLAVFCAIMALVVILAYGYFRPSFTPRYVMHLLPSLLLALAIWSRRMTEHYPALPAAVVLVFTLAGAVNVGKTMKDPGADRVPLIWQDAAAAMMAQNVRHVAFLWDSPSSQVGSQDLMSRVGGFFFDRAGSGIRSEAIILAGRPYDPDPNLVLTRYLDSTRINDERDGFIWLATTVDKTSTWWSHPARLEELAKQFECRDYVSERWVAALACVRRMPEPTHP